jgi:hypothetical protein
VRLLASGCVRECSGEHACLITYYKVNELIDGVGGGPHYLSTRKGHTSILLGWNRHLYERDTPVQCVGAFSLITH